MSNWVRGHGYYNAWDHKRPLTMEEFFDVVQGQGFSDRETMSRYDRYVESWTVRHRKDDDRNKIRGTKRLRGN